MVRQRSDPLIRFFRVECGAILVLVVGVWVVWAVEVQTGLLDCDAMGLNDRCRGLGLGLGLGMGF